MFEQIYFKKASITAPIVTELAKLVKKQKQKTFSTLFHADKLTAILHCKSHTHSNRIGKS